jgi:hypothetical protein
MPSNLSHPCGLDKDNGRQLILRSVDLRGGGIWRRRFVRTEIGTYDSTTMSYCPVPIIKYFSMEQWDKLDCGYRVCSACDATQASSSIHGFGDPGALRLEEALESSGENAKETGLLKMLAKDETHIRAVLAGHFRHKNAHQIGSKTSHPSISAGGTVDKA